jgi:hypothetical protein
MSFQTENAEFQALHTAQLFKLHGAIMDELRRREVVRTSNNPTGDYAEALFQKAFNWALERNSSAGHDAKSCEGERYQIKSRRMTRFHDSRQLGAIRNLDKGNFDCLAGVIFNEDYSVNKAIIVPLSKLSMMKSKFSKHVNGWIFYLTDDVWAIEGVADVTADLKVAAKQL